MLFFWKPNLRLGSRKELLVYSSLSILLFSFFVILGSVYFGLAQNWSFTNAVYFTVNSALSIGYGDPPLTHLSDRFVCAFYLLLETGLLGCSLGVVIWLQELNSKDREMRDYMNSEDFHKDGGPEMFSLGKWEMKYCKRRFLYSIVEIICILAFGTTVMMLGEDWGFRIAFYWACVTITTLGYGDLIPTTNPLRWFTTFYSLFGVIMLGRSAVFLVQFPLIQKRINEEEKVLRQFRRLKRKSLFFGQVGAGDQFRGLGLRKDPEKVDKAEFILATLLLLKKVPTATVKEYGLLFDNEVEGKLQTWDNNLLDHPLNPESATAQTNSQCITQ